MARSNRVTNSPRLGGSRQASDIRCFKVLGLRTNTVAASIRDVFSRWGQVERVELNLDENEMPDGTAIVLYKHRPLTLEFLSNQVVIDRRSVKIETIKDVQNTDSLFRDGRRSHRTRASAKALSLGVMGGPTTFIEEWSTDNEVAMVINYDRRQVHIYFNQHQEKYRLEFSFKDMATGDMLIERDNNTTFLTIELKFPARYWRQNANAVQETTTSVVVGGQWERIVDIPLHKDAGSSRSSPEPTKRKPVMPLTEPGKARLGVWTTYRLMFKPGPRAMQQFEQMLREAAEYNLVPRDTRLKRPILEVVNASKYGKIITHVDRTAILKNNFDVLYMLESLILSHQLCEYNLDENFYNTIRELDPSVVIGVFEILVLSKKRIWSPLQAIEEIFNQRGVKVSHQRQIPPHCARIRKITVTPTTMYLHAPQTETTNRVVRHFSKYADRFVRVQFIDDCDGRISASHTKLGNDAIYDRIFKVLKNGIQIGTRRYDFLAFSSAQLRDHACWFFTPTSELGTNQIRQWMGTFSQEKIVAKHAVRMGQCFSSTRPITCLERDEVETVDDVIHNGYTFSDGVGKISPALAHEVALKMDLKTVPSAFQFRFGGAKGVLTVSNFLKGRKIQLRPSQIKFQSDHYTLEVIRTSTLIAGYLNRQAITILSTLGVPDQVFMDKMQKIINGMNRMLSNPTEAIRTLMRNIDEFGTARTMARIIQAGFLEKRDPYIVNMINVFRISMLKDLKKKAKIMIPKGAFLLGVMDETNTLKEGEVFCQISEADMTSNAPKRRIITGETVVFRNPCFHPGDIRVLKAVDVPQLRHLCDVLVFPAQGYRDIPSMCSGGDLDGDDYTIFWDQDLIPKVKNYDPMEYKADEPLRVDEVKISHIQKFFVNYINNDNLGQIANAHLATADRSAKGALDGACLRLAQLHSLAVDFPKSGKPAKFENDLRVRVFPDFMQKKDKDMYESQKVLGRIFRAIDKADYKEYKTQLTEVTAYDPRLRVPGMERYIAEARELKRDYNQDVFALMNQYGVQTEAELMSGYVVKWLKKGNRKSNHEIQKQTMTAVATMKATWRRRFEYDFLVGNDKTIGKDQISDLEAKAAAWYYVTYHPEEQVRDTSVEGKFLSFPWVVDDYLCEIARKNNNRVPAEDQTRAVDDELVQRLSLEQASRKPDGFFMTFEEDTDLSDFEAEDEQLSDDDEAIPTDVLSLKHISPQSQQQQQQQQQQQLQQEEHKQPKKSDGHRTLNVNATEEELAEALLS